MNNIKGIVKFKSYNNKCTINYQIKNLTNGKHGFHVHKHGDLSQGCTSGCEHLIPIIKNTVDLVLKLDMQVI